MSGLAVFGLKFPSPLQFDESQEDKVIKHNLKTLYGINETPCDSSMRERVLEDYKILGKYLAIACDGTGMFSSNTILL